MYIETYKQRLQWQQQPKYLYKYTCIAYYSSKLEGEKNETNFHFQKMLYVAFITNSLKLITDEFIAMYM